MMKRITLLAAAFFLATATTVSAQDNHAEHHHSMPRQATTAEMARAVAGPHGGSMKQAGGVQLETVVSQGGIQMFAFDPSGQPISVNQGRGAASLRVEGKAKRYRYDLLPDGKGGLTAPVNLSQMAGRQIEVEIQLFGVSKTRGQTITLTEVAAVPMSETQLAAAAIARQKICPVSGKPLGSMGEPVAVEVNGQRLFVCCDGCVNTVKAEPAKFSSGRPPITVSTATAADAAAIAAQKVCPVMDEPLGGMGTPIKVMVGDKPIFLCCKGCIKKVTADPTKYLVMVDGGGSTGAVPAGTEQVRAGIFQVSAEDAPFIAIQKKCPVMDEPLDAMGGPYKVHAAGKAIYICCPGCAKQIAADPEKWLAVLAQQGVNAPTLR